MVLCHRCIYPPSFLGQNQHKPVRLYRRTSLNSILSLLSVRPVYNNAMDSDDYATLSPKVVLGVVAHPDDLDFGASGTLAKFAAEGAEVRYLILTDGSKGSEDKTMTGEKL